MKRQTVLKHEFVEFIPDDLHDGTVYVSMVFATVAHKCCCGCEKEVVTPLSPTDWTLIFDGESISLDPSIGNWALDCKSHYWIRKNKVEWAARWSQQQIAAGRSRDRSVKAQYFDGVDPAAMDNRRKLEEGKLNGGLSQKLRKWWSGRQA